MNLRRTTRRVARRLSDPAFAARHKATFLERMSRSTTATRLYTLVRAPAVREQQALLAGMAAYHRAEAGIGEPLFHLRRNIHRIEKGLSASNRRSAFAQDYIEETVRVLETVLTVGDPTSPTVTWAVDVLTLYFKEVEYRPAIDRAAAHFDRIARPVQPLGCKVPVAKDDGPAPVTIDQMQRLAARRRSVRVFLDRPVDRSILDQAFAVARNSPSACNRQAFSFLVYDDPTLAARVAEIAPGFDPQGRAVPCMVAVVGRYRAYYRERDRHLIYVDGSLASMALVLALESLGLASCCINWPSIPHTDRLLGDELGLAPDEEIIMLMAIGYADPDVPSPWSEKASLDELRVYNRARPR